MATQISYGRSIEPPPPAPGPSSGDGSDDGDVRPQQQPSPARAAEGGAGEDAANESTPPPHEVASSPAKRGRGAKKQ